MFEIGKVITNNEKIIWQGKPKFIRYLFGVLIFALIIGIIVILILTFLRILAYNYVGFVITNIRVIFQSGIIGRDYQSIDLDKIQDINVNVGLLDTIFKTGSIFVKTAGVNVVSGKNGSTVTAAGSLIYGIENPYDIFKILKEKLDKFRKS